MWHRRVGFALLGCGLLTLLGVAAYLQPDRRGYGTHEQLGLGPCTFATWFGVRCPTCGMTTAWSHLARGNVFAATQVHLSGTLLGVAALVTGVYSLWTAATGRFDLRLRDRTLIVAAIIVVSIVFVEWFCRLGCERFAP
jgi:hypothetical protein